MKVKLYDTSHLRAAVDNPEYGNISFQREVMADWICDRETKMQDSWFWGMLIGLSDLQKQYATAHVELSVNPDQKTFRAPNNFHIIISVQGEGKEQSHTIFTEGGKFLHGSSGSNQDWKKFFASIFEVEQSRVQSIIQDCIEALSENEELAACL